MWSEKKRNSNATISWLDEPSTLCLQDLPIQSIRSEHSNFTKSSHQLIPLKNLVFWSHGKGIMRV